MKVPSWSGYLRTFAAIKATLIANTMNQGIVDPHRNAVDTRDQDLSFEDCRKVHEQPAKS